MVRLDINKLKGKSSSVKNIKKDIASPKLQNENNEFEKFSQIVLKNIIDDKVPPTPNNFQIYFEKLLENKPLTFRRKINEYLEADDVNSNEYRAKMEKEIREGFAEIKNIVKIVSTVYKNLNVMKKIVKKRLGDLNLNLNQLSIDNVLIALGEDLEKLSSLTNKQMGALKVHYDKTLDILKDVESEAIFDIRYGVYNKKYLLSSIERELDAIKRYKHKSSIVMIKIKEKVLEEIKNSRERDMLNKNVARHLLKTSRRSDIVAHFGSGIFTILMKHTDLNSAQKACERIADLIYATSFFIGGDEVEVDIELGIMPIDPNYTTEETLFGALEVLPKTGKELEIYMIGEFVANMGVQIDS